jgi:cell shape-determining protein MreC
MTNLYIQDDVREKDVVVTSPDSVFPGGLPIGWVRAVQRGRETLLQTADIDPAVDPYQIDEVFVVTGADLKWENMAGLVETSAPRGGEELLDTQTLQERYAP